MVIKKMSLGLLVLGHINIKTSDIDLKNQNENMSIVFVDNESEQKFNLKQFCQTYEMLKKIKLENNELFLHLSNKIRNKIYLTNKDIIYLKTKFNFSFEDFDYEESGLLILKYLKFDRHSSLKKLIEIAVEDNELIELKDALKRANAKIIDGSGYCVIS